MIQFDDFDGAEGKLPGTCTACDEMLADALDGTLAPQAQVWFDRHIASCVRCSDTLADAQRGAAWLEMLKTPRPEPRAELLGRILAHTAAHAASEPEGYTFASPAVGSPMPVAAVLLPARQPDGSNLLAFRPRNSSRNWGRMLMEPRLAMTAAMAFFSIALTMNLTGVRLNDLHANDLRPASLRHSFYAANASAVRYYDNLRVVRVLESRVDDLRQQNEERDQRQQERTPTGPHDDAPARQQKKPEPAPGSSRREMPLDRPRTLRVDARDGRAVHLLKLANTSRERRLA